MAEAVGLLILGGIEAAGVAGAAAFGATTIAGVSVASLVGTAAIVGVGLAVSFATAPQAPKASGAGGTTPLRQPIPPRQFGYGRARLAGSYMLFEVDPATQASYDVLALHQGKVARIVHLYLNDDVVGVTALGVVNFAFNFDDGGAARYGINFPEVALVTIKTTLGEATETAFADVTAALPTLWTPDHRGDGVAALMLRCNDNPADDLPRNYPRGLPTPSVVADLAAIWDPRDIAQDREDPETWQVSSNPVLQILDYLTHDDRGPALDYNTFFAPNLAEWIAQADICDEPIAKADGSTEPRYKSDGWAFLTTDPAEVIGAIIATCDGWLSEKGDGTLGITVGKFQAPGITFTDDHVLGFSIDKGVADEAVVNEMQFSYTAPQGNWRDAPGVAIRDEASIAELGLVRSENLELTWVNSHSQGRRLTKRALARKQAPARGQIVTTMYGLLALGERFVGVDSRIIADLSNAVIEISKVQIDLAAGRITFDWTLVNPNSIDAWDPGTEEGVAPAYFPVPVDVTAADAGASNRINVEFDELDPAQPWLYYVVEYRTGAGAWTREVFLAGPDLINPGGGRLRLQTLAVGAGTYDVRIAATGRQVVEDTNYTAKTAVVGTTANITLSGEQTIDGVGTNAIRVLVRAQTNPAQNGIYVSSPGAWTRATDMDVWAEVVDAAVRVTNGATLAGRTFYSNSADSGTVGVTAITFTTSREAVVLDPDLIWAPDNDDTSVVIS